MLTALLMMAALAVTGPEDETKNMPEPTKEVLELIEKLGNDSFQTREAATKKLQDMGWPALKGLYKAIDTTPDPEIRARAVRIYRSYFYIRPTDTKADGPSIWYINEKLRFPKGFKLEAATEEQCGSICKTLTGPDIGQEYYDRIKKDYKEVYDYTNESAARYAFQEYIRDRLLKGEKRADLQKVVDEAVQNAKDNLHYYQSDTIEYPSYDWSNRPPGPMLKKDDFKEPNYGP